MNIIPKKIMGIGLLIMILSLSACGQSGPLYLPNTTSQQQK